MFALVWLLVSAGAAGGAPAPAQKDTEKEVAKLQGTWRGVSGEELGTVLKDTKDEEIEFVFKGDSLVVKQHREVTAEFKFSLDPSKSPKELDLHFAEADKKGKVCLAIYELDGDKLTICTNTKLRPTDDEKRPNVYSTKKPGEKGQIPGKLLFVLERQK
jgi:uncharacterized protein (TIGR03067 family)